MAASRIEAWFSNNRESLPRRGGPGRVGLSAKAMLAYSLRMYRTRERSGGVGISLPATTARWSFRVLAN